VKRIIVWQAAARICARCAVRSCDGRDSELEVSEVFFFGSLSRLSGTVVRRRSFCRSLCSPCSATASFGEPVTARSSPHAQVTDFFHFLWTERMKMGKVTRSKHACKHWSTFAMKTAGFVRLAVLSSAMDDRPL
jgi:hypothetical protein